MRIILTILLLAFTATFAFAADLNEMKERYDYLYKYKNSSSWKKEDCSSGNKEMQPLFDKYFTACYYTHSESGDFAIIREVYNIKTYEEVLNIHKNKLNNEILSLIDTFPKQTSKINEYGYAYYGKDGVLISIHECDYLFTKTKDGFVETIYFC